MSILSESLGGLIMRDELGRISFAQSVSYMGITGCNLGITVAERILHQSQILGFFVQIRAAAVSENMAGVAGMLQIAGSQCLVHNGANPVPGNAPHEVPIR